MRPILLAAAVAGAIAGGAASAATVSFSFSNALQPTDITQSSTLGLFDTNLGVLNSVTLEIEGRAESDIGLTNTASQSVITSATAIVDLLHSTSLAGLDLSSIFLSLSMSTGFQTLDAEGSASFTGLSDSDSVILTPSAALFSVLGGGIFTIGCGSLSGLAITGGGGNVASTWDTQAACGARVSYDYTPRRTNVPEPTTLALLCAMAMGAGRAVRRNAT